MGALLVTVVVAAVEVWKVHDDAVVGPDGVGLHAEALAHAGGQREPPGGVDAPAVGGEQAQPPVADLVAEALEHDGAIAGQHAGGGELLAQVGDEVAGGALVEVVLALERVRLLLNGPARERADGLPQLLGAPDGVALPEGHRAGGAGCGGDDHAVAGDLLDPPGGGAEQERLAGAGLVDHLLVELAHAPPVGQDDRVEAAVGDGAGVDDCELAGALARAQRAGEAVPHDAGAQLAELLGRVAPVEHVEHVLEQGAGEG